MDLDIAEPAADTPRDQPHDARLSRRGALAAAGLVGVAAAVAASSTAGAAPDQPTDADVEGLTAAMLLELAAMEAYQEAAGRLGGSEAEFAAVVAENHQAYAGRIAGLIGASAQGRDEAVYATYSQAFDTANGVEFGRAARELELTAVETHTQLLGGYVNLDAVELTASILVVEARHAAVFTSMGGWSNELDLMLGTVGGAA